MYLYRIDERIKKHLLILSATKIACNDSLLGAFKVLLYNIPTLSVANCNSLLAVVLFPYKTIFTIKNS